MRALCALVGIILLLVPSAAAQSELRLWVEPAPTAFTLAEQRATARVEVDCALLSGIPPEVRVELSVSELPPWLEADLDPATLTASPASCPAESTTLESVLKMFRQPADRAPLAGERETFRVLARATDLQGNVYDASAPVDVEVALLGGVAVKPGREAPVASPGERVAFTAEVVNGANAPVSVRWTPDARGRALGMGDIETAVPPETTRTETFTLTLPEDAPVGGSVELAYAWDALAGEESLARGMLNLSVRVPGETGPGAPPTATSPAAPPREVAAVPMALLLAGLVAVASSRRRA